MPEHRIAVAATLLFALLTAPRLTEAADTPQPESPRLRSLATALSTTGPAALDAFWKQSAGARYPLIEEIAGRTWSGGVECAVQRLVPIAPGDRF
jgi:hypothetical protein